jgi:translation initiation factor 3 subunit L
MLDEFIYQFQNFCFFRSKIKSAQDTNYNKLTENDSLPNLEDVKNILNRFIKESGIFDEHGKMQEVKELKTIHFFGYYSIVALCKLHVIIGETEAALEVIAPIDYVTLKIYSKSWSCLNSLFYFAGMAYLLNKKYIQATKLLETIVSFSNKYKHFFIKSFQYDAIMKQLDRALLLLCICLSLNQIPIAPVVKNLITDKYNDKFEKLLKYDKACFEESFTHGSCKMTTPLMKSSDFKTNGFLENTRDPMVETVNRFSAEFTKSQLLNNVEGILDLYPTISLKKFASIMNVSESEVSGILADFKTSKNLGGAETPFDATVVSKITNGVKFIEFSVVGDEIHVDMDIKEESHIMFFQKHCEGLEGIISKIELL